VNVAKATLQGTGEDEGRHFSPLQGWARVAYQRTLGGRGGSGNGATCRTL